MGEEQFDRKEMVTRDSFVCVFAGQLNNFQRISQILDLADFLRHDDIIFQIYGEGIMLDPLREQVVTRELSNVQFMGVTSKMNVFRKMQQADACLLFSGIDEQYTKWLPNKIFDYFSSGTPVIAMAQGELAKLVEQAGGVTVPPEKTDLMASEILKLSRSSRKNRTQNGLLARDFILSNYSREKQGQELFEIISTAFNNQVHP